MKPIHFIYLLSFAIFISCKEANKQVSLNKDWYNVAFLVTKGTFNTEFTAPYDIFQHTRYREGIKAMNVFVVSNQSYAITTFEGLRIQPDYNFLTDDLPKIDILVVPSAEHHLDSDMDNKDLINFIKKVDKDATYITSHCDGAFMLAKAGILDRRASTTFPSDIPKYKKTFPHLDIKDSVFFVHDGKYITSAGGAKSFEAALYLTELLYGDTIAQRLAQGLVIDWDLKNVPHFKK